MGRILVESVYNSAKLKYFIFRTQMIAKKALRIFTVYAMKKSSKNNIPLYNAYITALFIGRVSISAQTCSYSHFKANQKCHR